MTLNRIRWQFGTIWNLLLFFSPQFKYDCISAVLSWTWTYVKTCGFYHNKSTDYFDRQWLHRISFMSYYRYWWSSMSLLLVLPGVTPKMTSNWLRNIPASRQSSSGSSLRKTAAAAGRATSQMMMMSIWRPDRQFWKKKARHLLAVVGAHLPTLVHWYKPSASVTDSTSFQFRSLYPPTFTACKFISTQQWTNNRNVSWFEQFSLVGIIIS